jgi:hypothetical protein
VRKHYHCLWILQHWARVAMIVMSTSLVTSGSMLSPCWWGLLAWSTILWWWLLVACTPLSRGGRTVWH